MTEFIPYQRNWCRSKAKPEKVYEPCVECGNPLNRATSKGHQRRQNARCGRCYLRWKVKQRERLGRQ